MMAELQSRFVSTVPNRNQGIDLLRVIAAVMVVILHVLGQGGILKALGNLNLKSETIWFLETMCYCAVNTFALISGFVGFGSKHKTSSIITLWFQVVFYTVLSEVAIIIFFNDFSITRLIKAFIPVSTRASWYFTAYFVVFLFKPLLNQIIEKVDKKIIDFTLIASFIFFMIIETIKTVDVFGVRSGYSVMWLALLYMIGAYIKKYDCLHKLSSRVCALGFFGCVVITFLSRLAIEFVTLKLTGAPILGTKFITYTSPFMVLQAIFLLQLFSNLKLPKPFTKIAALFAPVSFGVYIAHTTTVVYKYLLMDALMFIADNSLPFVIVMSLSAAVCVFWGCSIIDWCRIGLFKLCGVNELSKYLGSKIDSTFERKT